MISAPAGNRKFGGIGDFVLTPSAHAKRTSPLAIKRIAHVIADFDIAASRRASRRSSVATCSHYHGCIFAGHFLFATSRRVRAQLTSPTARHRQRECPSGAGKRPLIADQGMTRRSSAYLTLRLTETVTRVWGFHSFQGLPERHGMKRQFHDGSAQSDILRL